jgi:hypothetical protein
MSPNQVRPARANHIRAAIEETRLESDRDFRQSSSGVDHGGKRAIALRVQVNR